VCVCVFCVCFCFIWASLPEIKTLENIGLDTKKPTFVPGQLTAHCCDQHC